MEENKDVNIGKIIVGLIFVDNYDEVLDTIEDIKKPLLSALIDRKLKAMAGKADGIVNKFEKDKYLFILSENNFEILKENKFEILNQIRALDMGNKIPVTLSIGIGIGSHSLSECMNYARAAIDLALGRGGDQVLIKDHEKFSFFGGRAQESGSNTRVRARVKAYALTELIAEAKNVIVMGHRNADLDSLGASLGVYKIVTALGKPCNILLDSVTTSIIHLYNRLAETKEYREKVFIGSEQAVYSIKNTTLVIVVDTHRPGMTECPQLLEKAKKVVIFDHHRKSAEFYDNPVLIYHEPFASSTCELVTEIMMYIKTNVKLMHVEADALLAGITVDTKNFAFKTGAKTFEAAAHLKRSGADTIRVRLLFQNDMESYRAKAYAVNSAEIFNGSMAISVCPSDTENPPLIAAQAADELLNISGIRASFVLCEVDESIVISARSLGDLNVQVIMEKLGGGGHQTVAGARVNDKTVDEVITELQDAISEYLDS